MSPPIMHPYPFAPLKNLHTHPARLQLYSLFPIFIFTTPQPEFESRHSLPINMVKKSKSSPIHNPNNKLQKTQHFKGVRMRKWGKWVSEVRVPNSKARIWLGSYDSPQQAARAYDCAVYCLRGCRAKFNFPDSLPEIPSASSLSPAQIQSMAAKFAREEIRQTPDEWFAFSGAESQLFSDEQKNWDLWESLLQDIESSHSPNSKDFLPPNEAFQENDLFLLDECFPG